MADMDPYLQSSALIDGSVPPEGMGQVRKALNILTTQYGDGQLDFIKGLLEQTPMGMIDFLRNRTAFGFRDLLVTGDLTVENFDFGFRKQKRIVINSGTDLPFVIDRGQGAEIRGDCLTLATVMAAVAEATNNTELVHVNTQVRVVDEYFRINGQRAGKSINTWGHTFLEGLVDGEATSLDRSFFYGALLQRIQARNPMMALDRSQNQPYRFIPALTLPVAITEPVISGGLKPYCQQEYNGGVILANIRLFEHDGEFGYQMTTIDQSLKSDNFSALTTISHVNSQLTIPGVYVLGEFAAQGPTGLIAGFDATPVAKISRLTDARIMIGQQRIRTQYSPKMKQLHAELTREVSSHVLPKLNVV